MAPYMLHLLVSIASGHFIYSSATQCTDNWLDTTNDKSLLFAHISSKMCPGIIAAAVLTAVGGVSLLGLIALLALRPTCGFMSHVSDNEYHSL